MIEGGHTFRVRHSKGFERRYSMCISEPGNFRCQATRENNKHDIFIIVGM